MAGAPPGLGVSFVECPFGDVGQAQECYSKMVSGLMRMKQIEGAVVSDSMNAEKYIMELAKTTHSVFMAVGAMFQQENLRTSAALDRSTRTSKREPYKERGIMEYKVMMNLKPVNGDKS